jgi:hypothetical protein
MRGGVTTAAAVNPLLAVAAAAALRSFLEPCLAAAGAGAAPEPLRLRALASLGRSPAAGGGAGWVSSTFQAATSSSCSNNFSRHIAHRQWLQLLDYGWMQQSQGQSAYKTGLHA